MLAQICIPVFDEKRTPFQEFSAVVPTGGIRWVLSEKNVYYVDEKGNPTTYPLHEQPTSAAVADDTLWLGTVEGALKFSQNNPIQRNVSITFPKRGEHRQEAAQSNSGTQIYVAFGTVLFSRPEGVYRYDPQRDDAERTNLFPGKGFGTDPYWWVTPQAVFALDRKLSANEVWRGTEPKASIPTRNYLWLADTDSSLVVISNKGEVTHIKLPGNLIDMEKKP